MDVSRSVDKLGRKFRRFLDAYEALEWLLARGCENLESVPAIINGIKYHLHRRAADVVAGTPSIIIIYTYDDDTVTIIAIEAEQAGATDEDDI